MMMIKGHIASSSGIVCAMNVLRGDWLAHLLWWWILCASKTLFEYYQCYSALFSYVFQKNCTAASFEMILLGDPKSKFVVSLPLNCLIAFQCPQERWHAKELGYSLHSMEQQSPLK